MNYVDKLRDLRFVVESDELVGRVNYVLDKRATKLRFSEGKLAK